MKKRIFYREDVNCLPSSLDEFIKILNKVKKDNKGYTNFTIEIDDDWCYDDQIITFKILGEKIIK